MSEKRLYTQEPLAVGKRVTLAEDRARYIGRVLRLRPDDLLTLFDGSGSEFHATILSVSRNTAELEILRQLDADAESPLDIRLLQGISRGERMDFVIQKATELGVHRITPVMTEYGVVKLDAGRALKKTAHWNGVAISACEQCGRNRLPKIDEPITLQNWMGEHLQDDDTRLVMKPGANDSLHDVAAVDRPVTLLIGPEGGFSESEYELADATGFKPIGFGPRILRTETAAVAIIAALQAIHGDCR
jgi:16S rRNA (uracil1498-N3)-methyltransferase